MSAPHRACGIAGLVVALAIGPVPAVSAFEPSPTELLTEGDAKASDGNHAEAARLYHEAFGKMSADERADMGELVVEAALESVRKAWAKNEDPALLELAQALIEDFEADMSGSTPEFIIDARTWLEAHRPEPDPDPEPIDDDGGLDDGGDLDGGDVAGPGPSERDVVGPALLGAGGALAVTGIVLLAVGAPVGGKAEDARDEAFGSDALAAFQNGSAADMMTATQFMSDYDQYVDDEKKRGRGMMIAGGVLLGVGVGLAAYGTARLIGRRRAAKRSAAMVIPTAGGVLVRF